MFVNKTILIVALFFSARGAIAQSTSNISLHFSYGVDLPDGDLADRFGVDFNGAAGLDYIWKNDWFAGYHAHMLLGSNVKEDVISNLRTTEGNLIGQQKNQAIVSLRQRAFLNGIHVGKFINISNSSFSHGPRISLGSSVLSHYIIFNDESATVNQLLGQYGSGYDRLTRGLTLEQFIGYQYKNDNGGVNVFGGFQFVQGFTQNVRPVDFDTRIRDDRNRIDLLFGVRLGVYIRLFEFGTAEQVYY